MQEISVVIGHSDFDSPVEDNNTKSEKNKNENQKTDKMDASNVSSSQPGNQSTISEMKEKPLDLFKHIDPDIDPTND